MSFLSPLMLWFGMLLVPLAAVYLLKVKPLRKPTTAFFLWDEIFEEKKASALFKRLQDLFSLLILALALSLLVMAMAGPVLQTSQKPKNLLLVVDNSVSMSASENGKTRLEKAKEQARKIVRAFDANTHAVLATLNDRIATKVNLTNNHRQLEEGIDSISETQKPSDISELRKMISETGMTDFRVICITDGNIDGIGEMKNMECIDVKDKAGNIGITSFDVVQPVGENRVRVFYRLASSYEKPKDVEVMLCRGDEKLMVRVLPVKVRPGVNPPETLDVELDSPQGRWMLVLEDKDALAADNRAYAVVPPRKSVKVGISGESGKYFFGKCVEAFERTGGLMELSKNPELVITQFKPAAEVKHQMIFQPQGSGFCGTIRGKPDITDTAAITEKNHPVMKMCDIEAMEFTGISPIDLPAGAVVLARGAVSKAPLMYKISHEGDTYYVLNFDPAGSGFFFSTSFPVMLYAMADDLVGMSEPRRITLRTGDVMSNGKRAENAGFVTAGPDEERDTRAVSVLSASESLLGDRLNGHDVKIDIPRGYPLAWWFCVAALLLIAAESVLYHRRKVG